MKCPLCGHEYDEHAAACHATCPMNQSCTLLCCPQCGYQTVDESKTAAGWLRRLWKGRSRVRLQAVGAARRLSDLEPGQSGQVVTIATQQAARLDRLSALGVVPGSRVTLRQRTPAFILCVGETELCVDESIAQEILMGA